MSLLDRMRKAFKVDPTDIHDTPAVKVGEGENGEEFVFSLRSVEGQKDQEWVIGNATIMVAMSSAADVAADILTRTCIEKCQAALSVAAINKIPVYVAMELDLTEDQLASIRDPMNPPDIIKYMAAKKVVKEFDSFFGDVLLWIHDQYASKFPDMVPRLPTEEQKPEFLFKCKSCHYITKVEHHNIKKFENTINNFGGIICGVCGEHALPAEGQGVKDEGSPLALAFGDKSETMDSSTS